MKILTRTRSIGGSLVVTIPHEIVKEKSIVEDELLEIEVEKARKSGFGMLKGVGEFKDKDREKMWRERV